MFLKVAFICSVREYGFVQTNIPSVGDSANDTTHDALMSQEQLRKRPLQMFDDEVEHLCIVGLYVTYYRFGIIFSYNADFVSAQETYG